MVEVSLTVGKLDASLALLLTKDHHLIEFPTILLPNGVRAGSIVKISCERDLETEAEEERKFLAVQDEILATFGKNLPKAPLLKIKNVTQTSCVLEWEPLDLGTASLKSLTLFKDGKKLGAIPQPLNNRTTKLSGLPIEKSFKFQLKLDSTAGVYTSDVVEVTTHKMTDLSGIQVCLGDITPNEYFTVDDIQQTLLNMGAHHPALDKMKVETTHFVATRENKQNPEFIKANDMNIPIIRPEWLKACERERRIVGVRDFYVKDCVLPDIFAKNYWQKSAASELQTTEAPPVPEKENVVEPETTTQKTDIAAVEVSDPSEETQVQDTTQDIPIETNDKKDETKIEEPVDEEGADLVGDTGEAEPVVKKGVSVHETVLPTKEETKDMTESPVELVETRKEEPVVATENLHTTVKGKSDVIEVKTKKSKVEQEVSSEKKESKEKVEPEAKEPKKEMAVQSDAEDVKAGSLEDVSL